MSLGVPALYVSWGDYLAKSTERDRLRWCAGKAKRANRRAPEHDGTRLTAGIVWGVLSAAEGRCRYCGSLAVEGCPTRADGGLLPWEPIGRRIGSLEHLRGRAYGGTSERGNLAWSCLWCNTWPTERIRGATDHGAIQDS